MRALVIVVSLAACGGGDLEGGGGDDDDNPPPPGDASAHEFCVTETNRYRTMNGRATVTRSAQLEAFADEGAMIDFSGEPHDHFRQTNGGGIAFAENECPHWNLGMSGGDMNGLLAQCIEAFMSEGPGGGHYENMLGPYSTLGCGIFESGGAVTIIQDFGN